MVGANRSQFFREEVSLEYAGQTVGKVWDAAARLGYSDYFVKQNVAGITDDHLFVNQLAKIPMIDIVHYQAGIGFFGDYHHTTKDNMSLISKETLEAVGVTLLNVVYYEE
jgi:glutaminyl-peptide cyclotransferase